MNATRRFPSIQPRARVGTAPRIDGFTLIEVLVMLVIVGVVVGALTLSIGGSGARELENAARRSQELIRLSCERATMSGRDIGFVPLQAGLRFGYYEAEGWRAMRSDLADELRARPWGNGVEVSAERDDELLQTAIDPPERPPFACMASGELTPLRLEFARAGVAERWELQGSLDGRLDLRQVSDAD